MDSADRSGARRGRFRCGEDEQSGQRASTVLLSRSQRASRCVNGGPSFARKGRTGPSGPSGARSPRRVLAGSRKPASTGAAAPRTASRLPYRTQAATRTRRQRRIHARARMQVSTQSPAATCLSPSPRPRRSRRHLCPRPWPPSPADRATQVGRRGDRDARGAPRQVFGDPQAWVPASDGGPVAGREALRRSKMMARSAPRV